MLSTKRSVLLTGTALFLTLALAAAPAAEAVDSNVRVTFTLGEIDAKGKRKPIKSFALVVTSGGPSASLLTGARVPIPTTTSAEDTTVTSYTYQNIGLSAQVEAQILPSGAIQINTEVENSWIDPETAAGQPVVETRHQRARVVLKEKSALEIARSTDGERIRYVEVQADILD